MTGFDQIEFKER